MHVHDTYFVVAHFHYIMVGGMVMGYLGRHAFLVAQDLRPACIRKDGRDSRRSLVFVGFNLTFFPQFILGYLGMPRRYHAYPPEFQVLNVMSTAGRIDTGNRLCAADDLSALVAALRQDCGAESLGRRGTRMADCFAAAN